MRPRCMHTAHHSSTGALRTLCFLNHWLVWFPSPICFSTCMTRLNLSTHRMHVRAQGLETELVQHTWTLPPGSSSISGSLQCAAEDDTNCKLVYLDTYRCKAQYAAEVGATISKCTARYSPHTILAQLTHSRKPKNICFIALIVNMHLHLLARQHGQSLEHQLFLIATTYTPQGSGLRSSAPKPAPRPASTTMLRNADSGCCISSAGAAYSATTPSSITSTLLLSKMVLILRNAHH